MAPAAVFHPGEKQAQELAGVREFVASSEMESYIRPAMPAQHVSFFENQPLLYVGAKAADGRVWASVLAGPPGFLSAAGGPTSLTIDPLILAYGDPVADALAPGASIGCLGLEAHTRRRNRLNLSVRSLTRSAGNASALLAPGAPGSGGRLDAQVDLSFGNCPKYIQARNFEFDWSTLPHMAAPKPLVTGGAVLGAAQVAAVRDASTLFMASCFTGPVPRGTTPAAVGCDVSHRGGPPGFVQVASKSGSGTVLRWADYQGNNMFQTFGNLLTNPHCGLLFIDYSRGGMLQLTGHAQVDYSDTSLPGAMRVVSFNVLSFVHHPAGTLPLRQVGPTFFSPYNPPTLLATRQGSCESQCEAYDPPAVATATDGAVAAAELGATGTPGEAVECVAVHETAAGIKTFEFQLPSTILASGVPVLAPPYEPGQYATFAFPPSFDHGTNAAAGNEPDAQELLRTWTVSSHPAHSTATRTFTISVKRVGRVSGWLHDYLTPGAKVAFRGFGGEFTHTLLLSTPASARAPGAGEAGSSSAARGVLMLAGGIGITPMRPILQELVQGSTASGGTGSTGSGGTLPKLLAPGVPVVLVYSVRHVEEAAFLADFSKLTQQAAPSSSSPAVRVIIAVSGTAPSDGMPQPASVLPGISLAHGRLSSSLLSEALTTLPHTSSSTTPGSTTDGGDGDGPLAGWHAFVCGPPGFMLAAEEVLQGMGMDMSCLHTESFNY